MVDEKPTSTSPETAPDPEIERARAEIAEIAVLEVDGKAAAQAGRIMRASIAKLGETAALCEMQATAREVQAAVIRLQAELRTRNKELVTKTTQITELEGELAEARARIAGLKPREQRDGA